MKNNKEKEVQKRLMELENKFEELEEKLSCIEVEETKQSYIKEGDIHKYIGKVVFACFPETMIKINARLKSYDSRRKEYVLHCGFHNRDFRCNHIKDLYDNQEKF